jgi:hypothetical protein
MSVNSKVLGAAVTLILVGGVAAGTLSAAPAGAATKSCGPRCIDLFSRQSGTYRHPNLVLDVLRQAERVGQPLIMYRASHIDPGEDFTVSFQGRVSDFYSAGLVTTWLARRYGGLGCQLYRPATGTCRKHYPNDHAYEIEYTPLGVDSGLCVGLPATVGNGTPVSLQPCGVSARTVWVVDLANSTSGSIFRRYAPLINGSQADSRHLYVLTYPGRSRQLTTQALQQSGHRGPVVNSQQWSADLGVLR